MSPPCSAPPRKAKPAMRMAISNIMEAVGDPATGQPIGPTDKNLLIRRSRAKPTNTPTCIRAWRAPRAKKASTKSPIGSKRSPKPKRATPAASRKRSTHLANKFANSEWRIASSCSPLPAFPYSLLATAPFAHDQRRQPRSAHARADRVARSRFHRCRKARRRNAPRVRYLSRLPPLLQSVRFLSAPVRPDRQRSDRRTRWREERRFPRHRRSLHAVRHVLHDEMPLRSAACVQSRFPASDAAPPRGGSQSRQKGFHPAPVGPDGSQRTAGGHRLAYRQLGIGQGKFAHAAADGKNRSASTAMRNCRNSTPAPSWRQIVAIRFRPIKTRLPSANARLRFLRPAL